MPPPVPPMPEEPGRGDPEQDPDLTPYPDPEPQPDEDPDEQLPRESA